MREEGKWEKVCDYLRREWEGLVINRHWYWSQWRTSKDNESLETEC